MDLGVIVGLLILNAVVGFVQDFQAGNIVKVRTIVAAVTCPT